LFDQRLRAFFRGQKCGVLFICRELIVNVFPLVLEIEYAVAQAVGLRERRGGAQAQDQDAQSA
jgi:hypothetical protein